MNRTKNICINAMGIALFVVLSMCLRVPVFDNYYVCLGYVVMMVYLYLFGITSGTIVGCIGTILYCILINGLRGMPGWVLANAIIGIIVGITIKLLKNKEGILHSIIVILSITISVFIGILIMKSLVENLLYSQPFSVRFITNLPAFISDVVTLILSIPFCLYLKKYVRKVIRT